MRKIEVQMVNALQFARPMKNGNTAVQVDDSKVVAILHGSPIVKLQGGYIYASLAGWDTATTRSRINAALTSLAGGCVYRDKGVTMLMGKTVGPFPMDDSGWHCAGEVR